MYNVIYAINKEFNFLFTIVFCLSFALVFLILQSSRLEECFKKGHVWQIKAAYFVISFVVGFLIAYGVYFLTGLLI